VHDFVTAFGVWQIFQLEVKMYVSFSIIGFWFLNSIQVSSNERIYLWSEIGKLDHTTVNIALDELIRMAIDGTVGSLRCENIAKIIGSLSSINVKGKLISRLRKASPSHSNII
jgi:hypothetical protein